MKHPVRDLYDLLICYTLPCFTIVCGAGIQSSLLLSEDEQKKPDKGNYALLYLRSLLFIKNEIIFLHVGPLLFIKEEITFI